MAALPCVSSSATASLLTTLTDMGFPTDVAEKALEATNYHSIESAIDWILSQEKEPSAEDMEGVESSETAENVEAAESRPSAEHVVVVRCEECNKCMRQGKEVEYHAAKTGHTNYSETEERVKPLTEEQKKAQLKKYENLIKQRRAKKEEEEKKEAIEKEKSRRKHGQELTEARQRLEEQEMKRLAEMKKREKMEARIARQKVLEDIERDKQARREQHGKTSSASSHAVESESSVPKKDYSSCRLQIRLTNGDCLVQTFSANEELAAVRLYVEMNRTDGSEPFTMMTSFPRKIFTEEDMGCPLKSLGLVPSAVIIVCKTQ